MLKFDQIGQLRMQDRVGTGFRPIAPQIPTHLVFQWLSGISRPKHDEKNWTLVAKIRRFTSNEDETTELYTFHFKIFSSDTRDMIDLLQAITSIQTPFNMIVLVVLIGGIVVTVSTIATETRKFFVAREEIELKRELLSRGMSSAEIERIIRVGRPD